MRHRGRQPLGQPLPAVGALDQDRELVTAQARHRVGAPGTRQEPLGGGDQQPVALGVAQAVVHRLEVVEIEEQHRHGVAAPLRQRQRVTHPVPEQCPVGEPGERVVERLMGELLLQPLPLAHVAGVEHDALHRGVVQQVGRQDLGMEPGAVLLAEAPLHRARDAGHQAGIAEERGGPLAVLGVEQLRHRLPHHRGRVVAQHPRGRGAHEADGAVHPGHHDHVGRVLHQRSEARLVLPRGRLGEQPDVLAHRQQLAADHQHRDQQRADREPAQRVGPWLERHHQQQRVGRPHRQVRQRADRLEPGHRHRRGSPRRHRAAQVQLRARDQHHVAQQEHRVGPVGAPAPRLELHQVEGEVRHHAQRHACHQQPERPPVAVDRLPEQHRGHAQEHQHAHQRIGERQQRDDEVARLRRGGRTDGEVPDDHRAADQDHRGVERELPSLDPGAPREREREQRGEGQERVGEVERIGPGVQRVRVQGEYVIGGDAVADEHHGAADGDQAKRPAHPRVQDLLPRRQGEQHRDVHVERHERHVADQVAERRAAPVVLLPDQVEGRVQRGRERDEARDRPGACGSLGLRLHWSARAASFGVWHVGGFRPGGRVGGSRGSAPAGLGGSPPSGGSRGGCRWCENGCYK